MFSSTQNPTLQLSWWLLTLGAEEYVRQGAGSVSPSQATRHLPAPPPSPLTPGELGNKNGSQIPSHILGPSAKAKSNTEALSIEHPHLLSSLSCYGKPGREKSPKLLSSVGA